MKMSLSLLLTFGSLLPLYGGGPWTQAAGGGYAQLSFTAIPAYASLYAKDGGSISLNREVSDRTVLAYGEYGITSTLTAIGELPFKMVSSSETVEANAGMALLPAGDVSSFGNIAMAMKYRLADGRLKAAAQLRVALPTADEDAATDLRSGIDGASVDLSLSVGGSHNNFFAFFSPGYVWRSNDYSAELLVGGEAGVTLWGRWTAVAVLDVRSALADSSRDTAGTQTGLYPDGQEYLAFGLKLIWKVSQRWGVNISGFGASGGNLVAKSPANTVGVYARF